jgi:CRP-like cAMP-binding protein
MARAITDSSVVPMQQTVFAPSLACCESLLDTLPPARLVKASTVLMAQAEEVKVMQLVCSGLVKLTNLNSDGREALIGLRSNGWYAGSTSLILNIPSIYTAFATTDCMVIEIPFEEFLSRVYRSRELLDHFVRGLCRELVSFCGMLELMSSRAEDRLNTFALERAKGFSTGNFNPLASLKQLELAQLLSITPEHLSRLQKKKQKGFRINSLLSSDRCL